MRKISSFLAIAGLLLAFSCSEQPEAMVGKSNEPSAAFWNLTGNIGAHDPSIIKEGNTWWVFTTGTGLPIKYSGDGKNWTQGTQRFGSALSWWSTYAPGMGNNDVWAPMCVYYNGRYWLYYSVSVFGKKTSAIGLTSCSSIVKGDWRDDGMVISSNASSSYNAIDPDITFDASGNPWLSYGSWSDGIHVVKLNTSTMKPTGTNYKIAYKSGGIEGPNIMYNGGYYYLFASYGVCCQGVNSTYKIGYGRSTSISGPYTDKNGVSMANGGYSLLDGGNARWVGPGGQSIYKNGSAYVFVRHAYDATANGAPTMLINDLYFSGGWPTY